jgi:hypothetical protein
MGADAKSSVKMPRLAPRTRLILALVLSLLIIRLLWGQYTARALRAQLKQLRDRGEPLGAGDFAFVELSDSHNAAKFHMDAARAFAPGSLSPRTSSFVFPSYPPYDAAWMAAAAASEQAHGKLFALAREARKHPRAQWRSQPFTGPLARNATFTGTLNATRNLANILADGAEYAHLTGNDAEALERARDVLHLSDALRQDDPLFAQLVALGIDAMASNALLHMAPGLRLDARSSPAARASAKATIAHLLDEEPLRRGVRRGLVFERAMYHELRKDEAAGTWVIRPLADAQLVRDHRNFDVQIDATAAPNKPQVTAALARLTPEYHRDGGLIGNGARSYRDVPRYSRWFGTAAYVERYFETMFRVIAERRAAAVSLAAQMFRADHGRWPDNLDELVPTYLPAVPRDPFADGEPLGYVVQRGALPDGRDRALIFHRAGEVDFGPYPEPSYSWESDRWPGTVTRTAVWQYRDLERFTPPPPPASTQAVDDEPQKPGAPGQQDEVNNPPPQPQPK